MIIQGFDYDKEVHSPTGSGSTKGAMVTLHEKDLESQELRARILSGRLKLYRFTEQNPNVHEFPVVTQQDDGTFSLEWRSAL